MYYVLVLFLAATGQQLNQEPLYRYPNLAQCEEDKRLLTAELNGQPTWDGKCIEQASPKANVNAKETKEGTKK